MIAELVAMIYGVPLIGMKTDVPNFVRDGKSLTSRRFISIHKNDSLLVIDRPRNALIVWCWCKLVDSIAENIGDLHHRRVPDALGRDHLIAQIECP